MSDWQPIESAPEETPVLVYWPATDAGDFYHPGTEGQCVAELVGPIVKGKEKFWRPVCGFHDEMEVWVHGVPTHWQPLLAAPERVPTS